MIDGVDVIFMPYNYLFDRKLANKYNTELRNSIVILDEAHNIERLCEDNMSFEFSALDIQNAIYGVSSVKIFAALNQFSANKLYLFSFKTKTI